MLETGSYNYSLLKYSLIDWDHFRTKILLKKFKKKKKPKTTLLILIDEFENIMGSMDREQINRNLIFIQRFAEIITQKNKLNLIIASQNKLPEELEERFNIIEI